MENHTDFAPIGAMRKPRLYPTVDLDGVARRLKVIRLAYDMTSGDFAASINVDPSSYSKIENGKKPLKMEMGFAISEIYGVSLDFIYRGRVTDLPEQVAQHWRQTLNNQQE